MRFFNRLLPLFLFIFGSAHLFAQSCISTGLNGSVVNLPCNVNCAPFNFKVPHLKSTSDYTVVSIPYAPFPFTTTTGVEPMPTYTDDKYSPVVTMPFSFCFYDSIYAKVVIGTNGIITFDETQGGLNNAYTLYTTGGPQTIPYSGGTPNVSSTTYYPRASIMGAYHDIDPSSASRPPDRKIEYSIVGTAPCRKFIVSYFNVPMFGVACGALICTEQIVLHESTGVVEVFLANKPVCTTWTATFPGLAILGMQNWGRDKAVAAPGKNATVWTASNEGYSFVPSGSTSRFTKAELLDISGTLLATTGITPGADTATTVAGMLDLNFPQQCPAGLTTRYIVRTYFASCTDNSQMISSDTITVNKTSSLNATATTTPSACGPNGSITLNIPAGAGSPPYLLSLDGAPPVTEPGQTHVFSGLTAGAHSILLTTSGGCSQLLNITVASSGTLTVNAVTTATSCVGATNGSVTLFPQNGTPPFQYSFVGQPFQTSPTLNNLPPGTFFVTIKDNSGCQKDNMPFTISMGPQITATFNVTAPACPGAANGSITVNTPGNGLPPYQYSVNGNPFQTNNIFTNLVTGTYIIGLKDSQGCINNLVATVPVGSGTLSATATPSGTSCAGANNGSITIVPSGGSAPYQYSLDNGATWNPGLTIPNLAPGSYSFIVKDNGGCSSAPISATITQGNALLATAVSTATSCSGVNNGTITVTPTNGSGPYTFKLDGGAAQPGNIFTNVPAGSHSVIVTDAANCISNAIAITVAVGPAITGTAITTATSCNGALNGSVTVTATNGSGPYTYQIDGGTFQASNVFNAIASGSHNVIIKDAVGCTSASINVTVTAGPPITGTATSSPTSCSGVNNGAITVIPANGSSPFQYSVDGGLFQTSNIFSGLNSGAHSVVIRDAAGCLSAAIPVNIAVGPPITGTANSVATSCNGAVDGIVNVIPSNGTGPYQYSIDGGTFQAGGSFNGVAAGSHSVVIRDAAGCVSSPISVSVAAGSTLTATVATTPTSCSGALNGTVTVTPTNTSGIYQYSLDGVNFQSSNSFTGLANGNYTITFKNNSGCQAAIQATVNPGQPLTATVVPSNVSCNGGNNGAVLVSISTNAVPPYQFSLDGINWQSANNFNGLIAGSYNVSFKDANNCAGNTAFTITQPALLSISLAEQAALCNGQNNGIVLVAATGGTIPYRYSIDGVNYQSANSFNLAAGNYTLYVKDNNGCTKSQVVTISEPAALTATTATTNASCDGGNDGTITVSVNGGTSGYQYSINGTIFQPLTSFNVAAGNYTVTIKDANGCTITRTATVGLTNNLSIIPVADTTICEGISVQLQPNTNATQFIWTPATGLNVNNVKSPNASPSITTEYIVKARLGVCSGEDTIIVNVLPAPVADAGPPGDICYGQSYQLQGSGGVEYFWSPSTYLNNSLTFDPVVTPDQTIQYSLVVKDANGCRSLQPDVVTVNVIPPIVVNISRDTVVALGDVFQLHASSVATDYLWSPGFGLSDVTSPNPIVTVTADVTYTVIASTPAGCKGEASVTIKVYEGPQIYVPTAFSPNGDGKNDVFKPFPVGISKYNYFRVFNRWGQMIYSTNNFNQGWDGTIQGKIQPTGTYVWMVEGITKENKKITKRGTVVLIR